MTKNRLGPSSLAVFLFYVSGGVWLGKSFMQWPKVGGREYMVRGRMLKPRLRDIAVPGSKVLASDLRQRRGWTIPSTSRSRKE